MARLFFAIWPPAATAGALARWGAAVQRAAGGRALDASRIHLTLAFLGEVKAERVAVAIAAARQVRAVRHELPLETAHYWGHNRIVYASPARTPERLEALVMSLAAALGSKGFVLERRPFAAHVTLLRKVPARPGLPPLPILAWPVGEFTLVCSTLRAEGSSYEIVERFALR